VVSEVDRYLELSDGSEYAYLRAGRLMERLKQTDAAKRIYEAMAKKHAESPAAQQSYAVFLYGQDKKEQALEIWRALATGADLNQTLHVARALVSRHEYETAFDLLAARQKDFDAQQLFYGQLVTTAVALEKFEEAVPWVLRRVELAQSVTELETAISQAKLVFARADQLETILQKLKAQSPRSVLLTCLLAELWEQTGDSEQADAVLQELAQAGKLLAVSQQIRLFTSRRDWQKAADATRRILELPGGQKSLHVRRLVELYTRDYQFEEALKWIESWRQLSPGSTSPWLAEARLLRLQGKEDDAVNVLRKASQRFDNDENLRAKLATTYTELGKLGDAERIYWQIYEQSEDLSDKLRWVQDLAKLSQQQGKTSQLVENFEARRRNNRRSIVPLLALAEIHRVADNYEGRRQALTSASKIKPDDLQLLLQIARIEENEGNWESALATLQRAAAKDKTNKTRQRIAGLHFQYGESDDGFAILQELLEGKDSDPRSIESFADAMCAMQEWEQAASFLQKHVADYPADYRLHYLLGVALEEADQSNAAADVFVSLLKDQEELPAKSKKQSTAHPAFSSHLDLLKNLAPPEAMDWIQLMQSKHTVYSYRQQNGPSFRISAGATSMGSRSGISIPGRVEDLRTYAIAHLVSLQEMLEEDQVSDLAARMEGVGVRDAQELLQLGTDYNSFAPSVTEILDQKPKHQTALAVMVLSQIGRQQGDTAEQCAQAFEVFRQSYPQLALMAAAQASSQEAEHLPLLKQGLLGAQEIKQPSPMLVISLVMQVGGMPGQQQQTNTLDAEHRKLLMKQVIDWYPHMRQSPQYSSWTFMFITMALRNSGDPSTYMSFLEDEVVRWNSGKRSGSTQSMASMFGGSHNNTLLEPLTFPPQQLVDFPASVLGMFHEEGDSNSLQRMMGGQPSETAWKMEAMKPLLKNVKNPILRVLFARQAGHDELNETNGQSEFIEQTLAKMLAADAPRADAYLMAAAWATKQKDHQRAVELLEKVRYLPMKRDLRRRVDAALVALAIDDSHKEKSTPEFAEKLKEAGRNAALRLRRGKLAANQREELIAAMSDLGLKKEAEKLERIATAAPATTSRLGIGGYTSARPSTQVQKDRVTKLVEQGKQEMAAKLLAKEVTNQIRQVTQNLQNYGWRRNQYQEIRKRVRSLTLEKKVLALLDPGESTNPGRLSNYASACELFEKPELARTQFEKILKRRPKDDNSRVQLVMLLIENDLDEANKHLAQLADSSSQTMGQVLQGSLNDHEMPLAKKIAIVRAGYDYVQILKDRKKAQIHWAEGLVQALGQQMYSRNHEDSLPSLYVLDKSNRKVPDKHSALQKERVELHSQLCLAMLESPQMARAGFKYLLAAAEAKAETKDEAKEGVGAEYLEFASNLLRGEAGGKQPFGVQVRYHYSGNQGQVRFRSPEEFLVRQAWETGDWAHLDKTLLPELEQARRKQPHQSLDRLVRLYRCEEEKFVETAKSTIQKQTRSRHLGMPNHEGISVVVDAWGDRSLATDIRPLILKHLKKEISGQNHHQVPSYVSRYTEHLADSPTAVAEALEEIATLYLGPQEQRVKFIKKNFQQNTYQQSGPGGRIRVFRQWMSQLLQREKLLLAVLQHLEPYGTSAPCENLQYYPRKVLRQWKEQSPEELMDTLARSSWLGELKGFQPLTFTGLLEVAPMQTLLSSISEDKKKRQAFENLLSDRQSQSPTFGKGLLLAAFQQKDEPASLLEYLGSQFEAIGKLPEERQTNLAALLKQIVTSEGLEHKELSPPALAAKDWIKNKQGKQLQKQLETLLAAKRFEELGIQHHNVDEYLTKRIPQLISENPQAASKAFLKVCDLVEDARRRGQWNMHYGGIVTLRGHFLGNLFNRGGDHYQDIKILGFLIDILKNNQTTPMEIDHGVRNAIRRCLTHHYDRYYKKTPQGKTRKLQAIQQLVEELHKSLGDRPTSLLIPGYQYLLSQRLHDDKKQSQFAKWLDQQQADETRSASMHDWKTALALCRAQRYRSKRAHLKEEKPSSESKASLARIERAEHHIHLESLLNNADLPLSWRMVLAKATCDAERDRMPLQTVLACMQVYNEALSNKVPLLSSQQRPLLHLYFDTVGETELEASLDEWREKWGARYLRTAARKKNQGDDLNSLRDTTTLCRALKLYLVEEDSERIEKMLRRHKEVLGSNRLAFALLIRSGKHALAAQLFRTQWTEMNVQSEDRSLVEFDQTLSENIAPMLEQLEQDDKKYVAEVLVASLSDSKSLEKEVENRDARLVRLAKRYGQIKFTQENHGNQILEILCTNNEAAGLVAEAVADRFGKLNILVSIQNHDQQQLRRKMRMAAQYCRNEFRNGNPKPFVETIDKLVRNWSDNHSHQFYRAIISLMECALDSISEDGSHWDAKQSAAVAESLRSILTDREEHLNFSRDFKKYNMLLLITHARAESNEQLFPWYNDLTENAQHSMRSLHTTGALWEYAHAMIPEPSEENLDERVALVRNLIQGAYGVKWLVMDGWSFHIKGAEETNLFRKVVKQKLLSVEEISGTADRLIEGAQQKYPVAGALAGWYHVQKEYEIAAKFWRVALQATTDKEQKAFTQFYLAESLQKAGNAKLAREALAGIDEKVFPKQLKKRYDKLKNSLLEKGQSKETTKKQDQPAEKAKEAA